VISLNLTTIAVSMPVGHYEPEKLDARSELVYVALVTEVILSERR
jgi:hypothetical protein